MPIDTTVAPINRSGTWNFLAIPVAPSTNLSPPIINSTRPTINNKKATLTEEKIKEFEEDVKNGKEIKVENYIVNLKKDYSNKISDFGLFTSKTFAKYFKKGLVAVFSGIDKMVN